MNLYPLSLMNQDGQRPQDTQRMQEEPQGEKAGKRGLFSEACPQSGETSGEARTRTCRIIKLENSAQVKESLRMNADTTQEIQESLCDIYPIDLSYIGMLFSTSPDGTVGRKFIEGPLPSDKLTIYIKLYLKKHPPLSK